MSEWHKNFFNNFYYELFMKRTANEIATEVDVIENLLGNRNISNILDVCCGVGDIANELAKRKNIDVWGIEYSSDYVENNMIKNILQGDARIKQTDLTFSLVLNWFSSFSYFNKEDNYKILKNCFDYCNDIFILETANCANIINNFYGKIEYNKIFNEKNYNIERISNINLNDNTLEQDWFISNGDTLSVHNTKSYIYFPKDIKDILEDIGFSKVELFGFDHQIISNLNLTSKRLLIKATK